MKNLIIPVALIFISLAVTAQTELGSEISYQGNLTINGVPVDGSYDFDLYAYDAASGGNELAQFLVDDANVNQGFFSVELDFGDVPFTGNQVWLEIRIREGSSNGGFQQLLPRYKINSSPYAIHAQFVGADAVGNLEIQDGSVTTTKLANDAVNSAKIIDGEVSNSDLADGAVNSNKVLDGSISNADLGTGAVTSDGILDATITSADMADGAVSSAKILDGSISNIDLDTGAVSTDSILDATITSADMADGAVGAAQINAAEVQQRITGGCSQGQYVSAINADGSIICNDAIDQSAQGVCQSSNGSPGMVFNGVCVLDYDNTQTTDWNTAVTSCSVLGGDLCSASQYVAMTTNGGTFNTSLFYSGRPRWTQDFSDNDGNSKGLFLHSSDDPSLFQQYSYACCGNVLPEPTRSNATDINGVKVTYIHDKQDTIWSTASQICHQKNSDLCTKSQLVALNDANAFGSTAFRRASNDLSDNDGNLMNDVLGTNSFDNANYLQTFAFACCGLSTKPTDNSCPGTVIAGVLASQPDNPNPNTDLFGYACCY